MADSPEPRNLSPLQQRLIALMLEGLADSATWKGLGVDDEELARETEEIRQILDVPEDVALSDHLNIVAPIGSADGSHVHPASERRLRLLLRLTIGELMEVSENASVRAQMLMQTVEQLGSDDVESAAQEAKDLSEVARRIKQMVAEMLEDVRGR